MAVTAAQLKIEVTADTGDAEAGLDRVDSKVQNTAGATEKARLALAGGGAAIAAGFGLAIKTAADFEAQISGINSVANLTGDQLGQVREKALQLGADTSFSASEAAAGMEELLKAGISYDTVMNGAAQAALDMAAATGVSVPQAAAMMSTAVNTFGTDATEAATLWSQAANASAADAEGLALGISQVGPVAAAMGLDLADTTTALALFSQHGLQGSDAGTSFKTMLLGMAAPTEAQKNLMNELGISFFDAQGNFIGLEGAADQLKNGLAGMTQEQRMATLQTLFGTDAIRAANILYEEGADGIREMSAEMAAQGTVQEMAAKRMDNLKGAIERMKGSFETVMIVVGSKFLPVLTTLANFISGLVDIFLGLPGPIQNVLIAGVALAGGLMILAGGAGAVSGILPVLAAGLGLLLSPIVLVVAAIAALSAALYLAYSKDLFGFAGAVDGLMNKLGGLGAGLKTFAGIVKFSFDMFRLQGDNPIEAAFNAISRGMDYAARRVPALSGAFKALSNGFKSAAKFAGALGKQITLGTKIFGRMRAMGLNPVAAGFQTLRSLTKDVSSSFGPLSVAVFRAADVFSIAGQFTQKLWTHFGNLRNGTDIVTAALWSVGLAVTEIAGRFGPFETAVKRIGQAFIALGSSAKEALAGFKDLLSGDLSGAADHFRKALDSYKDVLGNLGGAAKSAFGAMKDMLTGVDWSGLVSGIGGALSGLASTIWNGISNALSGVDWGGLADTALGLAKSAFDGLAGIADWVLDVGIPAVGGAVVGAFSTLWDWLKGGVSWLAGTLSDLSLPDWGISVPLPGILGDIVDAFSSAWEWVKSKVPWLGGSGGSPTITAEALSPWDLETPVPDPGSVIVNAFSDMWGWIKSKASWLADAISCAVTAFDIDVPSPGAIGEAAGEAFGGLCDWIKAKISWLADLGGTISDTVHLDIDAAVSLIGDIANWGGTMLSWIQKHASWLTDLAPKIDIKAMANAAIGLIGDIANWGGTMLSWLQKHAGWLADLAPNIDVAAVVDGTVSVADSLVSAFENAVSSALGVVKDGANWVWEGGKSILVSLGVIGGDSPEGQQVAQYENLASTLEGLQARITTATSAILAQLLNLDTYFTATTTSAQTAATDISTAWTGDVSSAFSTAASDAQTSLNGMQTSMGSFVAQAGAFGTAAGNAFKTNLGTGITGAQTATGTTLDSIQVRMGSFAAQAGAFGTSAGNQFKNNLTTGVNAARTAADTAISGIQSRMQTFVGQAGSAGQQSGSTFRTGIQAGMSAALGAVNSGVSQIKSAMTFNAYSQGYSGGATFGQGAVAGALAYVGSMRSAGVSLANAVVDGFNSVSKPGSPSKTATKQGNVYGEGLYVGATAWLDPLAKAGTRLAESLSTRVEASFADATENGLRLGSLGISSMPGDTMASNSPQYGSRDDMKGRVVNQTFNITIDVDDLPDLIEVREFLEGLPRERSLVFGGVA